MRMLRSMTAAGLLLAATALSAPSPAAAKDDLVIGIAEFPASLHPSIDPLLIKSYVLGFTIRTLTTADKDSKMICLVCSELPTLENGLAKIEGTAAWP